MYRQRRGEEVTATSISPAAGTGRTAGLPARGRRAAASPCRPAPPCLDLRLRQSGTAPGIPLSSAVSTFFSGRCTPAPPHVKSIAQIGRAHV